MTKISTKLRTLEKTIQDGLQSFIDVGRALSQIAREELYLETHDTWEDYISDRWGQSRSWGYQQIQSAKSALSVSTIVDTFPLVLPINEAQARELAKVEDENQRADVFALAWETSPKDDEGRAKLTAGKIAKARDKYFAEKSHQAGGETEPGAASDGEEPPPAGNSRETSIPEGVIDAVDVKDVTEPAEGFAGVDDMDVDDTDGMEADTDLCTVDLAEAVLSGWGLLRDNWDLVEDVDRPAILDWCQQTLEREGYVVRKRAAKKRSSKYSEDFEEFWAVYPSVRKRSKGKAWEAWRRAIRDTDPDEIVSAAQEYAGSEIGQGEYCQMPTTWLNGRCWEDDRSSWREPSNGRSRLSDTERAGNEFMESFS